MESYSRSFTPWTGPWPAPAKLNLMLRVLGRRLDGYHELQTVFQFLDCADVLRVRVREDGAIMMTAPTPGVDPGQDLVLRAARLLREATGTSLGAEIALDKRLPLGGGLGGGSSDAATVLCVLDRLWGTRVGIPGLARLGLALGADVPVFIHGRAAWAEGVGERLTPIDLPERWFLVIHPGVSVSTREVFQDPELTRNSPPTTMNGFLAGEGGNDCEPVVCRRHPPVAEALAWLRGHGPGALTGTGACVYLPCADRARAQALADRVPAPWHGFVARGLDVSPLAGALAEWEDPRGGLRGPIGA